MRPRRCSGSSPPQITLALTLTLTLPLTLTLALTLTLTLTLTRCIRAPFSVEIHDEAELSGFGGWFDVQFNGSDASPAPSPVTLSTAPGSPTHWAQQVFLVSPPQPVEPGDVLSPVGSAVLAAPQLTALASWG